MNTLILSALVAGAILSGAASLWLLSAFILSRWRGYQVARTLRRLEGREFPPREAQRRMRWRVRQSLQTSRSKP